MGLQGLLQGQLYLPDYLQVGLPIGIFPSGIPLLPHALLISPPLTW
jgi:hypothetical protein